MSIDECSGARPVRWTWNPQVAERNVVLLVAAALLGLACGDDEAAKDACLAPLPVDCSEGFTPTWDNVYSSVVRESCGGTGTGSSCHAPEGKQGGLEMSSSAGALRALLGEDDGRARVVPGDPECSILMQRIDSADPARRMPLGGSLSEADRCAVQLWIQQGAAP